MGLHIPCETAEVLHKWPMGGLNSRKRTLDDYFARGQSNDPPVDHVATPLKDTCFQHTKVFSQPAGLSLIEDFISVDEEAKILAFLDAQEWRTDLSRRTMHYGGTYCLMPPRDASPNTRKQHEQNVLKAPDMPNELDFLIGKMTSAQLYTSDGKPEYCIVNEYKSGHGISAHVENFRFGEPVCSLTLSDADSMRFHELSAAFDGSVRSGLAAKAPRTGRKVDVYLPRRSLLVLRRDARSSWQHEITRGRKHAPFWRRVSLTFRVDKCTTSA